MPTITTARSRTPLGRMLIARRYALELTREQVSVAADVPGSTYQRYERGETIPTLDVAARIARALQVSLDDLASAR